MNFHVITIFPEIFNVITNFGVTSRAFLQKKVSLTCWNPRDFTTDKHKTVDDRPYGGGPGMLMKVEPLQKAIHAAKQKIIEPVKTIYLSPQGERLTQKKIAGLVKRENILLLAGRYEGIDERLIEAEVDEELSIGDYVLSGGEIPVMVLMDALIRLLPGVLGDENSSELDSFQNGLLDYPQYTRPEVLDEKAVPPILLTGNHQQINQWREQQALGNTWLKRPDLLKDLTLTEKQQQLLTEFKREYFKHKGDSDE